MRKSEQIAAEPRTLKEWWLLNMPESHRSQEPEIPANTLVETAPPKNIPMFMGSEKQL